MSHSSLHTTIKRFTDAAHFASCRMQFMKKALLLLGTINITLFLEFPVSLYIVSSLDKFFLALVNVQSEKHWVRPSASERGRYAGLKTPSVLRAAPFDLYLRAQAFCKRVSAPTRPSKDSSISLHQKPSDGGCCTPHRYPSLHSRGETHGDWPSPSLTWARMKLETWPRTQAHQGRRVFPSFESRLLRTAPHLFTWPRSIFRHVYKHSPELFIQTKLPLNAEGVCLCSWVLKPLNFLQRPFAHF